MEEKVMVSTAELGPLISELKSIMQKKGYSPASIIDLEKVWMSLTKYASTVPITQFDEYFRGDFLRTEYGLRMDLEYTMYRANRALALLTNYINYGVVAGFPKGTHLAEFSEGYQELLTAFMDSEARRGLAESSLKSLRSRLFRLNVFLTDKGAKTFSLVQRDTLNDFVKYLAPYSTTYVSENLRMLRRLCTFAFQFGYHSEDLSACVPFVKTVVSRKYLPYLRKQKLSVYWHHLTGITLSASGIMQFFFLLQGWDYDPQTLRHLNLASLTGRKKSYLFHNRKRRNSYPFLCRMMLAGQSLII